jgi:hypothetical protein
VRSQKTTSQVPSQSPMKKRRKAAKKTVSTVEETTLNDNVSLKVARQVDRLKSAQESLNPQTFQAQTTSDSPTECKTCNQKASDAKYEQCSSGNDYLEKRMDKMQNSSPLFKFLTQPNPPEVRPTINPACVADFMEEKQSTAGIYRACQPGLAMTSRRIHRACLSERYVNVTANAFNLAATCLDGYIPKEVISTIAKVLPRESGYHVNAMNSNPDSGSGIGQLNRISIRDVNWYLIPELKQQLAGSKIAACRSIDTELFKSKTPMRENSAASCERLNLENGQPMLNIIYSMGVMKNKRKRMDLSIFNNAFNKNRFKLSEADMVKVREAVMMWSYNIGESVFPAVQATLGHYSAAHPVTNVKDLISRLKREIKYYIISKGGHDSSIHSNYYDDVYASFNVVDRNHLGGGKCLAK